ncbi:hypothetical protein NL676_002263 [Syzygium grande]|nr:hypothetical protein NL676_002263 [Syzygium grande]
MEGTLGRWRQSRPGNGLPGGGTGPQPEVAPRRRRSGVPLARDRRARTSPPKSRVGQGRQSVVGSVRASWAESGRIPFG